MVTRRIKSIQWLRGIAALLVVCFHAFGHVSPALPDSVRALFDSGVDLFFVISGFVIWLTTADQQRGLFVFARSRFLRVVPVYWLAIGISVIVALTRGKADFSAAEVLKTALFIPYFNDNGTTVFPITGVGWTLKLEMFFYALFALALAVPLLPRAAAFVLGFPLLVWAGSILGSGSALLTAYSNPIVIEFSFGILAAMLVRARPPAWCGAMLVGAATLSLVCAVFLFQSGLSRVLVFGVPYFGLVAGLAILERTRELPRLPWLSQMGDASYSTYLFHGYPVALAGKVIHALGGPVLQLGAALAGVVASAWAGALIYQHVERPVRKGAERVLDAVVATLGKRSPSPGRVR